MKKFFYLVLAVAVGFGAAKLTDRCSDDSSDKMSYAESEYVSDYCEDDSSYVIEAVEEYTDDDYEILDSLLLDWDMDSVYDPDYEYVNEIVEEKPAAVKSTSAPQNSVNNVEKQESISSLKDKLEVRTEELDKLWKKRYLEDEIFGLFYSKKENKVHILVDYRDKDDFDDILDEEDLDLELDCHAQGIAMYVRTTAFADDYYGNAPSEDAKLLHKVNPTFIVRINHKRGYRVHECSIKETLLNK